MDPEMEAFISNLDDDQPFSTNQQMNEMWKELEDYMDKELLDIDKFLDELLPEVEHLSLPMVNDMQVIETPAQISTKEFIKSFGFGESFYKDMIADPELNFKDKNFVPAELLMNSIRSRVAEFTFQHNYHMFENLKTAKLPMPPVFKDFNGIDKSVAAFDFLQAVENENTSWYNLLETQQIYPKVTVDSVVENVMRNHTSSQLLPKQDEIVRTLSLLFKALNNFINRLTAEFEGYKFFDASQFAIMVLKIQKEILSNLNITLHPILTKWIGLITQKFVAINDHRREVEERVSRKIIDRAVEVYKSQLEQLDQEEDISIVRREKIEKFRLGIERTYLNCGVEFNESIQRQLEERMEEVNSNVDKSVHSHYQLPSAVTTGGLNDSNVLIRLLVSEYVSNINQKGLQCAGIFRLHQFDDVNRNCLDDVKRRFEKEVNSFPAVRLKDLKKEFQSILDSESKSKRSEFEQKANKLSASPRITSPSSTIRSYSVGIHFGFEVLSVSYLNEANNNFRTIYGPSPNVVSFHPQGVVIGKILESGCSLNMETLLKGLNVGGIYDTDHFGSLRLEEVIALILMQIDQMTKPNLPTTSKIKYSIAIPSCFDMVMQNTFRTAMTIGGIEGNLVREQCALTTHFVRENHKSIIKSKNAHIITLIENAYKSCDSVRYDIVNGKKIIAKHISGHEKGNVVLRFVGLSKNGMEYELETESIKSLQDKSTRFIVSSADQENNKRIKNHFRNSKVHVSKLNSNHVSNGAAILSALSNANDKLDIPFDLRHLTSIKTISGTYRLRYTGTNMSDGMLPEISVKLSSLIENQSEEFEKCKAATKQFLMRRMKDLEDSNITDYKKKEYYEELEQDLKAVEKASLNELFVKDKADVWKNRF